MALRKKIKGNTLPEVLVALTITAFCSTLAVMIYLNIQNSTRPFMRLKASELSEKYLNKTLNERSYIDASNTEEGYLIKKTIKRNEKHSDCLTIRIKVYGTDQKLLNEVESTIYEK